MCLLFLGPLFLLLFPFHSVSSLQCGLIHFYGFTCYVYSTWKFLNFSLAWTMLEPSIPLHTSHSRSRSLQQTKFHMTTPPAFPPELLFWIFFLARKPEIMSDSSCFLIFHLQPAGCWVLCVQLPKYQLNLFFSSVTSTVDPSAQTISISHLDHIAASS